MARPRYRFTGLVLVLVIASTLTGVIASIILYNTALRQKSDFLLTEVRNLSRLIEAVARFDRGTFREVGTATKATLSQVETAFQDQQGFGESGEILLGRLQQRKVAIFLRYRDNKLNENLILPSEAARTEAMTLALKGQTGVGIFSDFRGERVLAAYTYIAALETGLEIKVAMTEIIRPYLYSGFLIAAASGVVILFCVMLVIRLSRPVIEELENHRLLTEVVVDSAQDIILSLDERGFIQLVNPMGQKMLGYGHQELTGKDFALLFDPFDSDTQEIVDAIRSRNFTNSAESVVSVRRRDRTVFPASITTGSNKLEDKIIITIVLHDLSALKKSEARIRELTHRMIEIKDREQDEISKELHDTIGTNLVWLKLQAQRITSAEKTSASEVENLLSTFNETIELTRNISQSLSPVAIEKVGLPVMLDRLADRARQVSRAKITVTKLNLEESFPEKTSFHIFRIVQEALNNALKHADATQIDILCERRGDLLILMVRDNGIGFDTLAQANGMGLSLIAERATLLKGRLSVQSFSAKGTEIKIEFPIV